jgi:hypothetical protein
VHRGGGSFDDRHLWAAYSEVVAFARDALGAKVRMADDSRMTIRPIESADAPLLAAAFDELSEESRYRRFFMA